MKKKLSVKKKIVVTLLSVIAAFLLVVIVYVLYVFGTYHRIKDKQPIEINSLNATEGSKVKTGVEYTAGTYNVVFGAYTLTAGATISGLILYGWRQVFQML